MSQQNQKLIDELKTYALDLMSDWSTSRSRQKAFILNYMANSFTNATEAAKGAGFSEKTARITAHKMLSGTNKFLHIPPVVEKLKLAFDERQTELSILSNLEIEQFWADVVRGKIKDVKLVGVGEGEQVVKEVPADLSIRLNAADKAARSKGMYQTNIDITQRNIDIKVGDWDADED